MLFVSSVAVTLFVSSAAAITPHAPQAATVFPSTTGFTASSFSTSAGGAAVCLNGKISVTASANNTRILYSALPDQRNGTGTIQHLLETYPTTYTESNGGSTVVSGTWSIASRLCFPATTAAAAKVTTVQLLTHGATLDSTYWDFANGYSYINAATAAGYATSPTTDSESGIRRTQTQSRSSKPLFRLRFSTSLFFYCASRPVSVASCSRR
jgi:hypothetical protein